MFYFILFFYKIIEIEILPHMIHLKLLGQFWYVQAAQDHLVSARVSKLDEASSFSGELALSLIFKSVLNCSLSASTRLLSIILSRLSISPDAKFTTKIY